MRFFRFKGHIFNVDRLVNVWYHEYDDVTHIVSDSGADKAFDLTFKGNHCARVWELLTESAANSPIQATIGRNLIVEEALDA